MCLFLAPSGFNGARSKAEIYMERPGLSRGHGGTTKAQPHWECDHENGLRVSLYFTVDGFKMINAGGDISNGKA